MTAVGIIGVGYLGECLAQGLAAAGSPPVLSPRNAKRVAALAERHGCPVAAGNAEVVERADLVFLATRPAEIVSTAAGLPWRSGQRVVSIAAGIGLQPLQDAVSPAKALRAMPIASSRIRRSPTAFCPPDDVTAEVLGRLGSAHPVADEEQYEAASVFGAFYGWMYAVLGEASGWAEANGMDPVAARQLSAGMAEAAAAAILDNSGSPPRALLDQLMTPGGITAEGLKVLEAADAVGCWSEALDASLRRARAIAAEG